jgi:thiol-disulfide isomerase/thioredoxin
MLLRNLAVLLVSSTAFGAVVQDVRAAIANGDFAAGERQIAEYRREKGVTAEMILALSWLGRGALASQQLDKADAYAAETRKLALEELKKRRLDAEKDLPLALGASIEVQSQAMAARGERDQAVSFLKTELARWKETSIITRLKKNLNLISLEGKPAPPISAKDYLGPRPKALKGRPTLLFLWAHWCGDCKQQAPIVARIRKENPELSVIGLTQRYGYVSGGEDAPPAKELKYIDQVRQSEPYSSLEGMPVPVSEQTFSNYGASTTPTLVLVDREGIVRLYHPGKMTYEELAAKVAALTSTS